LKSIDSQNAKILTAVILNSNICDVIQECPAKLTRHVKALLLEAIILPVNGIGNESLDIFNDQKFQDSLKRLIQKQVELQTQVQKDETEVLKAEILQLKSSQEFLSQKYDDL